MPPWVRKNGVDSPAVRRKLGLALLGVDRACTEEEEALPAPLYYLQPS